MRTLACSGSSEEGGQLFADRISLGHDRFCACCDADLARHSAVPDTRRIEGLGRRGDVARSASCCLRLRCGRN
eukprot:2622169-Pleurochrysis_carterae.AAC.4